MEGKGIEKDITNGSVSTYNVVVGYTNTYPQNSPILTHILTYTYLPVSHIV